MPRTIEMGAALDRGADQLRPPIRELWGKFHFPGNPPPIGSVAEARIIQCARDYIKCVEDKAKAERRRIISDDVSKLPKDDYRTELRRVYGSDSRQREFHNRLAIMIYGSVRTEMPFEQARDISDFAAGIVFPGLDFKEFERMARQEPELE